MKFIRFILLILISISIFGFVTFFNAKMLFSSSDTVKGFLNESNIYPVAAAGIRDNIVKYAEVPVGQSELIEVVNSAITEADLKLFVEDYTDQFYNVVNGKTGSKKITLHFVWLRDKVADKINSNKELKQAVDINNVLSDRELDLSSNSFVSMLIHINNFLIGFGIAIIVFILLLMLSGTWSQKFIWLGAAFIASVTAFIGELAFYYFGISEKAIVNLAKMSNFKDEKFLIGVQKLITIIMEYQKFYYASITIGLVILGIVLIIIGRSLKKHDMKMEKI